MQDEKLHQLALTLVPGLGDVLIKNLISYIGSAKEVFRVPKNRLLKVPGIGPKTATDILKTDIRDEAEKQLDLLVQKKVKLLFYTDQSYPYRLKQIYNAPALIYQRGTVDLNAGKVLAIVGTRKATDYGKQFVSRLLKELNTSNLLVISGLAYGIDIEAHKAAMDVHLPTLAVIASGVDIIYPAVHKKYALQMINNGGLLSEYPLGTTPEPARFPARNRIIAGLSDATLIVEAAETGGALITADLALGYNREVFALPGRAGDIHSAGCNNLIKQNSAQLINSAEDLLYYMQWDSTTPSKGIDNGLNENEFTTSEWKIIQTIRQNGDYIHIDELSWKSQVQIGHLATILLNLEFRGIVNSLPGKKYSIK